MRDIERAERRSKARAIIFYLMATVLILNVVLAALPLPADPDPASGTLVLGMWLVMIALTVFNLLPVASLLRQPLAAFMNDETTQAHRRNSFAAGFWAAIGSAGLLTIVASIHPLAGVAVAKLVITASLVATLVSFATQELRAAR